MKKYKVPVIRISYSSKWIEVTAENEEDAKNIAFEKAYDMVFDNESHVEYTLDDMEIEEITNN